MVTKLTMTKQLRAIILWQGVAIHISKKISENADKIQ